MYQLFFRKKSPNLLRKLEEEVRTEKEGTQRCKQIRTSTKALEKAERAANVQIHALDGSFYPAKRRTN